MYEASALQAADLASHHAMDLTTIMKSVDPDLVFVACATVWSWELLPAPMVVTNIDPSNVLRFDSIPVCPLHLNAAYLMSVLTQLWVLRPSQSERMGLDLHF